ncbi:uncharacterized protein EDB93DRAFT_1100712 [Suillus bovinus]|uniref:uncharacterized protein n=1 Tax=Suillus bovinus TaxID=48563 RepID=UPI001B86E427|nr:uncharacterized protein EDB93DRAFT_1100712 [Suillus bovinus]KAG2157898.1 hypothetical protein EDB93DRAFT_1100712 [Suillus bovinus]
MPFTMHTRSRSSGNKSSTLSPPTNSSAIPTITTMSSLQATVTAITLSQTDLDKIEVLDHSTNNWGVWSNCMQNYLLLKHRAGYILGLVTCPDPSIDPEEDFLTIMMLNAMAEDLPHVRNHIADAITTSTSAAPYGPSNIRSHLEVEQQIINIEKSKSGDVAMAATGRSNNAKNHNNHDHPACDTCGHTSHPTKDCFGKGGAIEGKRDEVLARKRATRKAKGSITSKAAATGKPGSLQYDTTGRAYLLDSKTHQVIYVATPDPANPSTPSAEFASLVSDTITPAFICELSAEEEDEYMALAAVEALTTSLDWRLHIRPVNFTGITYKVPNQHQCTIIDPSIVPLFLDSGASIHISNEESDFFSLHPIPPRAVNGVSGSSIQAVGVGTLCLVITRGIHITLDNVLFIPAATHTAALHHSTQLAAGFNPVMAPTCYLAH